MIKGIEGAAFDLDGTMYPNHRFNYKLIPFLLKHGKLLSVFGKTRRIIRRQQEEPSFTPIKTEKEFYRYQAEIVSKMISLQPDVLQEKIEKLMYRGWEPLFKKVKLYKNAKRTITLLREAGYKTGLLSDFPPETKLENLGLSGIWDAVLCSEHCGALKPYPLSFLELAKAMSLPPEKILYVGNSRSYDVAGAAGAGMKTAWIKHPFFPGSGLKKPKPDFSFSNYRQLINFMIN